VTTPEPSRYEVPRYRDAERFPDEPALAGQWTVHDYTLAYALGLESNHQAAEQVARRLDAGHPEVASRVRFEPEHGCFFAHTTSEQDLETLVDVIAELVSEHHRDAIPGDIGFSPAYLRRWDPRTA
jgi:hypothetical protein